MSAASRTTKGMLKALAKTLSTSSAFISMRKQAVIDKDAKSAGREFGSWIRDGGTEEHAPESPPDHGLSPTCSRIFFDPAAL